MDFDKSRELVIQVIDQAYLALVQFDTYAQLGIVVISVFLALLLARQITLTSTRRVCGIEITALISRKFVL